MFENHHNRNYILESTEKNEFRGIIVCPINLSDNMMSRIVKNVSNQRTIDMKGWFIYRGFENKLRIVPATPFRLIDFIKNRIAIKKILKKVKKHGKCNKNIQN